MENEGEPYVNGNVLPYIIMMKLMFEPQISVLCLSDPDRFEQEPTT